MSDRPSNLLKRFLLVGVSIHWTGLLDWTTGLESFWIRHMNGVMQIISLVYVDHAITYESAGVPLLKLIVVVKFCCC